MRDMENLILVKYRIAWAKLALVFSSASSTETLYTVLYYTKTFHSPTIVKLTPMFRVGDRRKSTLQW